MRPDRSPQKTLQREPLPRIRHEEQRVALQSLQDQVLVQVQEGGYDQHPGANTSLMSDVFPLFKA